MVLQAEQVCHKPSGTEDFFEVPFFIKEGMILSNQLAIFKFNLVLEKGHQF